MISNIRLHGKANKVVEYHVTVTGEDLSSRYFYESHQSEDRFFSGGNEFVITSDGVRYSGSGGSLCEYMFGVDLPLKDLLRKDVVNRLVMNGAFYDEGENITFSSNTSGGNTFDEVFLNGNAFSNYFFFIHPSEKYDPRELQREILRSIGKQVKRSEAVGASDDAALCREIYGAFGDRKALVFLFRLVNLDTAEYYRTFHRFYTQQKTFAPDATAALDDIARERSISPYQQERIKIDGMYKLPENKKIVDEYKDILIGVSDKGEINPSELAKLSRLRTLSLRLNIPHLLFDTLDDLLLKDMHIVEIEEPDYIRDTRAIFEGLFFRADKIRGHVSPEDLTRLLKAKEKSTALRDPAFESLLLDTVRLCDEHARDADDLSVMEAISAILTYFDRYDSVSTLINNLAFMENSTLTEDNIRSITGNKEVFDAVDPALFRELFFDGLRENRYLTRYGRKKVDALAKGLNDIKTGDATYRELATTIGVTNEAGALFAAIHRYIKERFRSIYAELNSQEDQEVFIQDLNHELQSRGIVSGAVPREIFEEIILDIRKESFYLNNLLPHIIISRDNHVREDFLTNSGLDRFYVEELERDYFSLNQIDDVILEEIRR